MFIVTKHKFNALQSCNRGTRDDERLFLLTLIIEDIEVLGVVRNSDLALSEINLLGRKRSSSERKRSASELKFLDFLILIYRKNAAALERRSSCIR